MWNRQRKPAKSESDRKGIYTIHHMHDMSYDRKVYHDGYLIVASIDPAVKNYSLRIERRPNIGYKTPIEPLVYFRLSLDEDEFYMHDNKESTLYITLNKLLDSLLYQFLDCDMIIIEKQLPFKPVTMKIEQHTIAYFMNHLKDTPYMPLLIEMDAKTKGKMIGSPSGMSEKAFKTWCTKKAIEILNKRNDQLSLDVMKQNGKKLDDLSDTVCQIEAMFKIFNLPLTDDIYGNN